jgi:hypothetical protein
VNPESPEAGTPQTVLFARVKEHLKRSPFVPFRIVTTSGRSYDVPTADHAGLLPVLRMIYVADDSGGQVDIHALHVASIEPLRRRKRAA